MKFLKYILILVSLLSAGAVNGQWRDALYENARSDGHLDIGFQFGYAYYQGDLQHDWFPNYGNGIGGGIYFKKFWNKNLGYRFGINHYRDIYAHDSSSVNPIEVARNLRFHTHITEANVGLELNFIPYGAQFYKFTPYVFGGLSMFYFNPWTDSINGYGRVQLKQLGTEGQYTDQYPDRVPYPLLSTGFFFGGGFKGLISDRINLGAEIGFRYTSTDYIDDVSRTYVNLDTLRATRGEQSVNYSFRGDELETFSGEYPSEGYLRGDPSKNDWYYSVTVTFGWYFDLQTKTKRYPFTRCIRYKENNPKAF